MVVNVGGGVGLAVASARVVGERNESELVVSPVTGVVVAAVVPTRGVTGSASRLITSWRLWRGLLPCLAGLGAFV